MGWGGDRIGGSGLRYFVSLDKNGESFTAANQEVLETQTAGGRIAVLASWRHG